jgi:opacity protein-like surface antigen
MARKSCAGIFLNESVLRGETAVRQRSQNGLRMTQTRMARKLRHDERYQSSLASVRGGVGFIGWSKTLCYVTGGAAWASTEYNGHMTHYRR